MSENAFWVSIWTIVAACFISLVVCITVGIQMTNEKILKADTCEKVVAIEGAGYGQLPMLCIKK